MKRVTLGIDFGMCNSRIAYIDKYCRPVVIPNEESKLITPSVVHFYDQDSYVVGDEAVNMLLADPDNTVGFVKRRIGHSDFKLSSYGKEYTSQEISALILKKLKTDAESYFRNQGMEAEVKDVVITVPAYFGMEQKGATKEAAELAGLHVFSLIPEPIAVAMAFGVDKLNKDQTVFVFDLGGSTLDVTLLEIKGNDINMIASNGDPICLGGNDWDDILVNYCSNKFKEKYGEDPRDDSESYQELYERVLKAKISLSKLPKALITVSHNRKRDYIEITTESFEALSIDLLKACTSACEMVTKNANKTWNDIDTVLLAGGATYMPMIRNLIREMCGKELCTDVMPDQCVALGAAHLAAHPHERGCKCCEYFFQKRKEEDKKTSKVLDERDIDAMNMGTVLTYSDKVTTATGAPSKNSSLFDEIFNRTYYEILGIPEDAEYEQIKTAYEKEYLRYMQTRDKEKGSKRFYVIAKIWECLKDPVSRRKYNENFRSQPGDPMTHIGMPQLTVDRKGTCVFGNIKRGSVLTEKIIIRNTGGGLMNGTIKADVPWIELDRDNILDKHEQELYARIVTSKIDSKLDKVKGKVIIDSNGGLNVVTFEVSITD